MEYEELIQHYQDAHGWTREEVIEHFLTSVPPLTKVQRKVAGPPALGMSYQPPADPADVED